MISKIIRNFIAKQMAGRSDDGIMITLRDPQKVELAENIMADLLMRNGIDPKAITSEAQLKTILKAITRQEEKVAEAGIRNTKSAKVFEIDTGKEIPKGSKIMGGKAVDDDLPPPGSRGGPDDIAAPVQSSEESLRDMIMAQNKANIDRIKSRKKMLDDAIDDASPGFSGDRKVDAELVAENLAERMGLVYDDLPTKQRLDLYDQAYTGLSKQRFKGMRKPDDDPEEKADGGRIGFNTGSGLPLDPMDPDNKLNAVINAFKKLPLRSQNRIGFKKFFQIYARENFADGGRIGFKMGRRAFLKALGAGIGGAAAIKTGIIGLGTKKAVTGAGEKIITAPVKGKPEWFDALVNKVIREGDDVTKQFSTKEREIVHKLDIDNLDDVRVTQDLDQGMIKVEYNSPNNMGEDTVELVFKSGRDQMDETTGKVADEFYAVEKEPRAVGGPEDADLEFDGENLVKSVDDLQSDTSKLKQIATGKKQTMSEFVNSKKKKDRVKSINEDQVEQAEYLETKYGPYERYLSEDVDADFASGGLAGMLGQ